jgi:hypothetical protein
MDDVKACKQSDCEIRNDGKCLEGLDIADCPHFYWTEIEDEDDADPSEPSVVTPSTNKKRLFPGTELSLKDLSLITHRYACDLVIILGDLDSGKTTLLATIFDLFQIGQLTMYSFAGSLTQKGFEIRSHKSRMSSGKTKSDTERTKTLEFRILHIALKNNETSQLKHLLLSDISGETIKLSRSSASTMKEQLAIVKMADHIIYIIDGEKLAGPRRTATILEAELFIRMAIDNGIFNENTILNVLVSKWDFLENLEKFDLDSTVVKKISTKFSKSLREINFRKIASRPEEAVDMDLGYGVEELIEDFMQEQPFQKRTEVDSLITSNRLIDKFKVHE